MKILLNNFLKGIMIFVILFNIIIQSFELSQKNKELYLECIKLKQELGNENIKCEKILLEKIKNNLTEQIKSEEKKASVKNDIINKSEDEEEKETIKKYANDENNEENTQFNFSGYIDKIEKFIEGEMNHLNKFKFFLNDLKQKTNKMIPDVNLNKMKKLPQRNAEKKDNYQKIETLRNEKRLRNREEKPKEENFSSENKQKMKNFANNEEDLPDFDINTLKEKFSFTSSDNRNKKNSEEKVKLAEKSNQKSMSISNLDVNTMKSLLTLLKNKEMREKEKKDKENHEKKKEETNVDEDLMKKINNIKIGGDNNDATDNLFKKFLSENMAKMDKHNSEEKKEERIKEMKKAAKEKENNFFDNQNINYSNTSVNNNEIENKMKYKNDSNQNELKKEFENFNEKTKNKTKISSIVEVGENLNLDSLKNLLNESSKQNLKDNNENKKNSEENKPKSELKNKNSNGQKSEKLNDNSYNFSLGEIESQIELLKNLSIKP